ncbi:MAG: hypothetical protein WBA63_03260 [Thermomicrobiales bacterium]
MGLQGERQIQLASTMQDFGMYGTYTAEMQYRRARREAELVANGRFPASGGGVRARIGGALVRWGQRLEGRGTLSTPCNCEPAVS